MQIQTTRIEKKKARNLVTLIAVTALMAYSGTSLTLSAATIVVPDNEPTIQDAIDEANSGDTIHVKPGTYSESVNVNKDVTLQGLNDPAGASAAVIDGNVTVTVGGATIRGLKVAPSNVFVAGGVDPHGILVSGDVADVTVEGNVVAGMTADSTGGSVTINGIQLWNSGPTWHTGTVVRDNTVHDFNNQGDAPLGWPNYGGAAAIKVQGLIEGAVVENNDVSGIQSAGWTYGIVTTHTGNAPGIPPKKTSVEGNVVLAVGGLCKHISLLETLANNSLNKVTEDQPPEPKPSVIYLTLA